MRPPVRAHRADALATPLDPLAVVLALRRRGPVVALETTRPSDDHGRQTIVAGAPLLTFGWSRGRAEVTILRDEAAALRDVDLADAPTPFHALERLLDAAPIPVIEAAGAPPLGAFGFFGYECREPPERPRLAPFPDAWFLLTDTVVHWPTPEGPPTLWSASDGGNDAIHDRWRQELQREIEACRDEAAALVAAANRRDPRAADRELAEDLTRDQYAQAFRAARAALARGDSYQLCFTYPLARRFDGDPLTLHARLRRENPAPFAAFLSASFGAIASSSPERFLRVDRRGVVEARPMKGTAARPEDAGGRARAARDLVGSEKMRAENLMIADLLRNDLGRVCRLGSVRAARPALLEEHATLLQLVSVIEGELAAGRTRADLLASCFPPGSMTGAPKVRSIELLQELESGPRGPYSGALGYLAKDGRMDLAVVIRSALVAAGVARVNVGGGIVWDSEADAEFDESRLKAAPLLRALAAEAGVAAP